MGKRRFFRMLMGGVVLVGMFVAVALVVRSSQSKEPEYEGKKLSEWVLDLNAGSSPSKNAIREIGTNALPYLLKWMRYDPPPWKPKLYQKLNPLIAKVQPRWVFSYKKLI